jgi:hypothetical protein
MYNNVTRLLLLLLLLPPPLLRTNDNCVSPSEQLQTDDSRVPLFVSDESILTDLNSSLGESLAVSVNQKRKNLPVAYAI